MEIDNKELLKAVKHVCKAAMSYADSAYRKVKIETLPSGVLGIAASNPALSIVYQVDVYGFGNEIAGTVEADTFLQGVLKLGKMGALEISCEEGNLNLKSGKKATVSLPLLKDGIMERRPDDVIDIIKNVNLYSALQETKHALGKDGDPKQSSFFVEVNDESQVSVTTLDGFRVSKRSEKDFMKEKSWIVSGKAFIEAVTIVSNSGGNNVDIIVTSNKNYIIIKSDFAVTTVAVYDGEFFNVDKIVSDCYNAVPFRVSKEEMLNAVDVCTIFNKVIKLEFAEGKMFVLSAEKNGKTKTELECETKHNFTIGVNGSYLKDALMSIAEDEIDVYITSPVAPIMLSNDRNATEIVIPIRLN